MEPEIFDRDITETHHLRPEHRVLANRPVCRKCEAGQVRVLVVWWVSEPSGSDDLQQNLVLAFQIAQ